MKRRDFLKRSATLPVLGSMTAGAFIASGSSRLHAEESDSPAPTTGAKHPIRLGAPFFLPQDDPEKLAHEYRQTGYRAAYCPNASMNDLDRVRAIEKAFRTRDITIAEVGRWCNLMDADPGKRQANLDRVTEGLSLADEVGARCCVDIAGSFNTENWAGPDPKNVSDEFFHLAVENARKIIDAVKPKRAKFTYEIMQWSLPDSVDSYLALIKAIDRDGFGVHLDPANLINSPRKFYDNTALINDCFDRLGPYIASCHAKDVKWSDDARVTVKFDECILGQGKLDYRTYLSRLARLPGDVPLMMEHLKSKEQYDTSRDYLHKTGRDVLVVFDYMT